MNKLMRIYRDPQENEPTSIHQAIMDAPDEPVIDADKPIEGEKPASKFAWGEEDRRKSPYAPKDEDELDLDWKDDKGESRKFKLSEIKAQAKWLKENSSFIASADELRKQLNQNPDLNRAYQALIAKSFEGGKYNAEGVSKVLAALEGKAEKTQDKIEDATDDIKEMETLLNELDSDSPQAKILKTNIASLKATRTQLKAALGTIEELKNRTGEHDKFRTGFEEKQKQEKADVEAKQAGELFDTTFGALTASQYKFDDTDDTKEFEDLVRDQVATLAQKGKINNDQEFAKSIQDSAKAAFERISKRNERIVNKYLKVKGKLPPEKEVIKEEKIEDGKSIGELIAEGMFASE